MTGNNQDGGWLLGIVVGLAIMGALIAVDQLNAARDPVLSVRRAPDREPCYSVRYWRPVFETHDTECRPTEEAAVLLYRQRTAVTQKIRSLRE